LKSLVLRCNYGDESITQIAHLHHLKLNHYQKIYVVYIDTGWAATSWHQRVEQGELYAKSLGFVAVHLKSTVSFEELIKDRKCFPSKKFQWCAGFLKGIPLINWLDEHDPQLLWDVAIPKRQALYRQSISEYIDECEYHGERRVWHPILNISNEQSLDYIKSAGFDALLRPSQECEPCINSSSVSIAHLSAPDIEKTQLLEQSVDQAMFKPNFILKNVALALKTTQVSKKHGMDGFTMGCGDPFGCGL
jgi:hypothetical protein